jgi:HD superfamily phosphodiesterase
MKPTSTEDIADAALKYIDKLFQDQLPNQYLYHDLAHTIETVETCREIGEASGLNDEQMETLLLAAFFHDSGYIHQYEGHEEKSCEIARGFLEKYGYPNEKILLVEKLIKSTNKEHSPKGILENILHDADVIKIGKRNFFDMGKLLRAEWEIFLDEHYTDEEWEKLQHEFLLQTEFKTKYAREKYGKEQKKNIERQRQNILKTEEDQKKGLLKSRSPGRGIETMFRSIYRTHINLSSIADNKANMMISMNTIILSVIITVIGSGFTFYGGLGIENFRFSVPIAILLITCAASVVFAIFSARPKVTNMILDENSIKKKESSLLFFGNFTNLSLDQYLDDMKILMNERELLYDHMTVDIYFLGKVLHRKYRLLRISYNVFMVGLLFTVSSFIIIFFFFSGRTL